MNRLLNVLQTFATPHLTEKLKKVPIVTIYHPDEERVMYIPGVARGNKPYAWLQAKRFKDVRAYIQDHLQVNLQGNESNGIFSTLTVNPEFLPTPVSSWRAVREALPSFIRKFKKEFGVTAYITKREAHKSGYCHVHLAGLTSQCLKGWRDKNGKLRSRKVTDFIRENWPLGLIDAELVCDATIGGYLTDELGKYGQVENSLRRAKSGTLTDRDVKVMLTHYYADISRSRLFTTSRNLAVKVEEGEGVVDPALLLLSNNPTTPRVVLVFSYAFLRSILGREDCFYTNLRAPPEEFELIAEWLRMRGRQMPTFPS